MSDEIVSRDLTKWPRLLVTGQSVSEDQANEILIRTDSWMLMSNDSGWIRTVCAAAGLTVGPYGWPEGLDEFRASIGALNLSYLENSRIASSWIGGPHGWCSWSGRIGCSTYNLGKWPSTEAVCDDWEAIAAAFPYLDLTAQLVADEGDGELVGQWTVRAGTAEYEPDPTTVIRPVDELESGQILGVLAGGYGERGIDITRLAEALRQVRTARAVTE